ncbi:MAG: hypothetical protein sL5_09110 [Candidatus Mesenet longicola]|uniref:Uncharacterized protein n=1 Tax=Candidatus Mesenet longicola TaxID=1892558 RepID=A0A8J3HTE1_9RICK|nr:MAG: hypothetical protein sGL2_07140 [Candidatus Mesenet longicola]GHM59918.1 MAG: hypothetical protein sL5_09110 [Candidatus Mesenet longicola]
MVLLSYQKQKHSQDREIVNAILMNGSWINPKKGYLEAAKYLSKLGFIEFEISYFVICANELDLDFPDVYDSDCKNQIIIAHDFNEDCDDLSCEDCGRYILPNTYKKQRSLVLSIKLNIEKTVSYFESLLAGLIWQKAGEGVYHISFQNRIVSIVIPVLCTDTSYLTADRLRINPTVLITLGTRDLKLLLNLYTISMADLICKHETLKEVLLTAVEKGIPELLPNVSLQALNYYPYVPLQYAQPIPPEKILQLQIQGNNICINNIEVIDKHSKSGNIFFILLEQFWQDFKEGISKEQYKALSVGEIANRIGNIFDVEQQIRKPINRMQKNITEKLAKTSGLNVKRDDVIQTLPWSAMSGKEYGYRLNPFILIFRK